MNEEAGVSIKIELVKEAINEILKDSKSRQTIDNAILSLKHFSGS